MVEGIERGWEWDEWRERERVGDGIWDERGG